jgi:hypothetical protein
VELKPSESQAAAARWNAVLATPPGLAGVTQIHGTAWMEPGSRPDESIAQVTIENAAPGGKHPWHVHRGQCGNDQGIVGPADAYHLLEVGGDGRATRTARLPLPLPTAGDYMVNIHASTDNMGTIIACGNLAPPIR